MAILWYVGLYLGSMYVCVRCQSAKLNNENLGFLNSTSVGSHFNVAKHACMYIYENHCKNIINFHIFGLEDLKMYILHMYTQ